MASNNRATAQSPTVRAALSQKRREPEGVLDHIGEGQRHFMPYRMNDLRFDDRRIRVDAFCQIRLVAEILGQFLIF